MRISDWSSDVCSSDLIGRQRPGKRAELRHVVGRYQRLVGFSHRCLECLDIWPLEDLTSHQQFEQLSDDARLAVRSEEHTSELQSLMRISYAVFCLKKKQTKQKILKQ